MLSSERVLVTGAGGFLAGHLIPRLLDCGAQVYGLIRPGGTAPPGVRPLVGDLTDPPSLERALAESTPHAVFHLAGSIDRSPGAIEVTRRVNLQGSLSLLQACRSHPPRVVVVAGTGDEYGSGSVPFHEQLPLAPRTPYAASKAALSLYAPIFTALGVPVIHVRMFLVYGPRQGPGLFIPQLLAAIRSHRKLDMTAGEQTRDFIWVGDAVEAMLELSRRPDLGGRAFNVCTGQETSLKDVMALLGQALGRPLPVRLGQLPYREGELFRNVGAPDFLQQHTGYRLSTSLPEGLERCLRAEGLL